MRSGHRNSLVSQMGRVAAGACTAALVLGLAAPVAHAETSKEVRDKAAQQNERLNELVTQLEEGREELADLDRQMNDLTKRSVQVQSELIEDRSQLRTMVDTSYRWGGGPSIWDIALSSETLDDFVSRLYYANKVTQWQTGCVQKLDEDKRVLDEHISQIETVRDDRRNAVADLEETCAEVQDSVDELLVLADGLDEKERTAEEERLTQIARQATLDEQRTKDLRMQIQGESEARELAEKAKTDPKSLEANAAADEARAAEERAAAQSKNNAASANDAAQKAEAEKPAEDAASKAEEAASKAEEAAKTEAPAKTEDAQQEAAPKEEKPAETPEAQTPPAEKPAEEAPAPEPQPEAAPDPAPAPAADSDADWVEVIASAYTDEDGPNNLTASGVPLDNSVPTVALPIAMNPSRFYGSQVEIEYEGMSVVATVTDCGSMGGGSRGLDLTPAVFEAFGAETGDDWGLREVRYRFL